MNWGSYAIFDPGVDRPLSDVTRPVADAAFRKLMASREERINELRTLVAPGVDLDAPNGLDQLDGWFTKSVEANPSNMERLRNEWYSVVNDIGLLLGERAISASNGQLRWTMCTTPKDASYQRHVITGFSVANPRYHVDFDVLVGMYGQSIVAGENTEPNYFTTLLRAAAAQLDPKP
jgi:hypothetical protein